MGLSAEEARAAARREVALRRAIHAACRARGIDEETRHDMQRALTGKESLTEMNAGELGIVLDRLNGGQGGRAQPESEWSFVFRLPSERRAFGAKIYRLAQRLGPLQSPPRPVAAKVYVEGIARQMCGCLTALEFCGADLLRKIVQALEVHLRRHGA